MKPLELTVYPPAECSCELSGETATGYNWNCDVLDHGWMGPVRAKKRFTDAELAAEMFSAVFHEAECEVRGVRIEKGFPPRPGHPAVQRYVEMNHEFGRQADILRRFATLPHYDEPDHG